VGLTAGAMTLALAFIRGWLLTIKLSLGFIIAGLQSSEIVVQSIDTLDKAGMDSAAQAARNGDILTIATMSPESSTSEGQARDAIQNYRQELVTYNDARVADDVASTLTASVYDKELLASMRRAHKDIVKDKLTRRQQAAVELQAKVESISK